MDLTLPAGPLSVAIASISLRGHLNIACADPRLLRSQLPALHLHGSPETALRAVVARANLVAIQKAPDSWLIVEQPRKPALPKVVPTAVADIIVSGSKRQQSLEDDAMEVFELSDDDFSSASLPDTASLAAKVPSLASTDWGAGREKLFMRGVADSSFMGNSPTLVGEYLGDLRLNYNSPDPDLRLYDVRTVEVMEGPQGTLYGSGAMGGLLRIEPNNPDMRRFGASIWSGVTAVADGGQDGDVGAILNVPLIADTLSFRGLGYEAVEPGYVDNPNLGLVNANRTKVVGGRGALRWQASPTWFAEIGTVVQRTDNRDAPYSDLASGTYVQSSTLAQPSYDHFTGAYLSVTGHLGSIALHDTAGFVRQDLGDTFAVPSGLKPELFSEDDSNRSYSNELRLSSRDWVIGASISSDHGTTNQIFGPIEMTRTIADLQAHTIEKTIFGEFDKKLLRGVTLTLGGRYTRTDFSGSAVDNRRPYNDLIAGTTHARTHDDRFLPSVGLAIATSPHSVAFARFERGFRPGGLTISDTVQAYESDRIDTFEAGYRHSGPAGDPISWSVATSYSRWRNIQADLITDSGFPYIVNVGNGSIYSIDGALDLRLARGLSLSSAVFAAKTRLQPFSGQEVLANRLPNVARTSASLTLDYQLERAGNPKWEWEARYQHVGKSVPGFDLFYNEEQGGFNSLAATVKTWIGRAEVTLDATNLLNSRATIFSIGSPFAGVVPELTRLRPRAVRIGARYNL